MARIANTKPISTLPPWRLMRVREVEAVLGRSRATLYRLVAAGDFPAPVKLGSGQNGAIAWREDEILSWIEARQEHAAELRNELEAG